MSASVASRSAASASMPSFGAFARWRHTLGAAFNAPYGSSSSWARMKNVAAWSGFFFFQAALFHPTKQLQTSPSRAAGDVSTWQSKTARSQ